MILYYGQTIINRDGGHPCIFLSSFTEEKEGYIYKFISVLEGDKVKKLSLDLVSQLFDRETDCLMRTMYLGPFCNKSLYKEIEAPSKKEAKTHSKEVLKRIKEKLFSQNLKTYKMKNSYIAVYGTLRPGEYNFEYFKEGLLHVGSSNLMGYSMYNLGSYPCIVPTGNKEDSVYVDILEVLNKETMRHIDGMESGVGYFINIEDVTITNPVTPKARVGDILPCKIYYFSCPPSGSYKIESGDWINRGTYHAKIKKPRVHFGFAEEENHMKEEYAFLDNVFDGMVNKIKKERLNNSKEMMNNSDKAKLIAPIMRYNREILKKDEDQLMAIFDVFIDKDLADLKIFNLLYINKIKKYEQESSH